MTKSCHGELIKSKPVGIVEENIWRFLSDPQAFWCTISFNYPLVVVKSYKAERRFFVPPPSLAFSGEGWVNAVSQKPQFSGTCQLNLKTADCEAVVMSPAIKNPIKRTIKGYLSAGNMFLCHSANQPKITTISAEIQLKLGSETEPLSLGSVVSEYIQIVSKKSHRKGGFESKTKIKDPSAIRSGQRIALYQRCRAGQATRFLYCYSNPATHGTGEQTEYCASDTEWSVFTIYKVNPNAPSAADGKLDVQNGELQYGDHVRLVELETGCSLPPLVIREASAKNRSRAYSAVLSTKSVCQQHIVVFERVVPEGSDMQLLYINEDRVTFNTMPQAAYPVSVADGSLFNIVSAQRVDVDFALFRGIAPPCLTGAPLLEDVYMHVMSSGDWELCLSGDNFAPGLTVWLGMTPCVLSHARSVRSMFVSVSSIEFPWGPKQESEGRSGVPLMLVSADGTIFLTAFGIRYSRKPFVVEVDECFEPSPVDFCQPGVVVPSTYGTPTNAPARGPPPPLPLPLESPIVRRQMPLASSTPEVYQSAYMHPNQMLPPTHRQYKTPVSRLRQDRSNFGDGMEVHQMHPYQHPPTGQHFVHTQQHQQNMGPSPTQSMPQFKETLFDQTCATTTNIEYNNATPANWMLEHPPAAYEQQYWQHGHPYAHAHTHVQNYNDANGGQQPSHHEPMPTGHGTQTGHQQYQDFRHVPPPTQQQQQHHQNQNLNVNQNFQQFYAQMNSTQQNLSMDASYTDLSSMYDSTTDISSDLF